MPVAILTQFTPNPNAMKFILNRDVKSAGKMTFTAAEEAASVPLVADLFALPYIQQIHLFENVITITKAHDPDWDVVTGEVKDTINSRIEEHDPSFEITTERTRPDRDELDPEIRRVEEVLDRTVRPYLQGDGGDLDVVAVEDHRVVVDYQGACGTCPSAVSGTLQAIQGILRDEVDPQIEVVSLNGA